MEFKFDLHGDPDKLLEQASEAARSMIDSQLKRQAELEAELAKVKHNVMRLSQLVALGATATEDAPAMIRHSKRRVWIQGSSHSSTLNTLGETSSSEEKEREATALIDIETVLLAAPEPLTVSELKDHIRLYLDRTWAESTLYNHLGRGKAEGRYVNENNKWSMVKPDPEISRDSETKKWTVVKASS